MKKSTGKGVRKKRVLKCGDLGTDQAGAVRWGLAMPSEMSELWGVTPRRIYQLAERGIIPKSVKGRYDVAEVTRAYLTFLREGAESKSTRSLSEGIKRAQKEKLEEEALLLRMKREEQEGRLIDFDEVKSVFGRMLNVIRRRLDNFSKSVAVRANPSDHRTAELAVQEAVDSVLAHIATAESSTHNNV